MTKSKTATSTTLKATELKGKSVPRTAGPAKRSVVRVTLEDLNFVAVTGQQYAARRQAARLISPELMARPVTV